jgi:SAM-dependent methyltransferase
MSTLLHIGCGPRTPEQRVPVDFADYTELRMDIDPATQPDITGSILAIDLPDNSVDAIYASHILEHVERWQVATALAECFRVLRPGGQAVFLVPDLQAWCVEIVAHPELIEKSGAVTSYLAPVSMLDALFGFGPDVQEGNEAMRHRSAFTQPLFARYLAEAGFAGRIIAQHYMLCAVVRKETGNVKEIDD